MSQNISMNNYNLLQSRNRKSGLETHLRNQLREF